MKEKHEECGVVGIYSKKGKNVAPLLYKALVALQHRGQDATGMAIYHNGKITERKGVGIAGEVFSEKDLALPGAIGIGHTRYPTIGGCSGKDAQPTVYDEIAVAHNGHIANYNEIRQELEKSGYVFTSTVDSEPVAYWLHREKELEKGVRSVLENFEGAFSDVALYHGALLCFRDKHEIRPLVWGENEEIIVIASETVALDVCGASYKGDVPGGGFFLINNNRIERVKISERVPRHCMFEYVYFSRPDSIINGKSVHSVRLALGSELAREAPARADVVIPVPDTSRTAAMAYAKSLGLTYDEGLIKNRYIARTFIMPTQKKRTEAVQLKLNPLREVIAHKRVVLIDDSIVRGTTVREIVQIIRSAGAKEVHVRITSPPIISPCFYGVDIPTYEELIASSKNVDEIARFVGADSLAYLSIDGLRKAIGLPICEGCITGKYHTTFVQKLAEQRRSE
ncbi:MAG: amidophosphoribosyltransferase [Candidatus Bilamarchaeaceae archaeon]